MNFEEKTHKKSSYKFSEVTSVTSVKPYVLRFWETEFDGINPELLEDGSKIYRESDIEMIQEIKELLFERKMSIPEAKAHILSAVLATDSEKIQSDLQVDKTLASNLMESREYKISDVGRNVKLNMPSSDVVRGLQLNSKSSDVTLVRKKLNHMLTQINEITLKYNW